MLRKLRLEAEGGIYRVIERGNSRADIFRAEKTKAAFLQCLDEVCDKNGWRAGACVVPDAEPLSSGVGNPAGESGRGDALTGGLDRVATTPSQSRPGQSEVRRGIAGLSLDQPPVAAGSTNAK